MLHDDDFDMEDEYGSPIDVEMQNMLQYERRKTLMMRDRRENGRFND